MPPARPMPDNDWADFIAQSCAEELIAGKLIDPSQWDFARKIIAQQIGIQLTMNCYPAGDLQSH